MPLDKIETYFMTKTYVMSTQNNRRKILLSNQTNVKTDRLIILRYSHFYSLYLCFPGPV